jgi:hypothetical protein
MGWSEVHVNHAMHRLERPPNDILPHVTAAAKKRLRGSWGAPLGASVRSLLKGSSRLQNLRRIFDSRGIRKRSRIDNDIL